MEGGRPRDSGQSIEDAIDSKKVSFSQQFTALYRQYDSDTTEEERARWAEIYVKARAVFEDSHGGLHRSWYANGFSAGVALTADVQLHEEVWFDTLRHYDTVEAARLWTDLRTLHARIDIYLAGNPRDGMSASAGCPTSSSALIYAMGVEWRLH